MAVATDTTVDTAAASKAAADTAAGAVAAEKEALAKVAADASGKTLLSSDTKPPATDTTTDTKGKSDTAKPADAPPVVKYDLQAPKGSLLDAEAVKGIEAFATEQKLSPEQAKALLAREDETAEVKAEKVQAQLAARSEAQKAAALADPEFGGAKFVENSELAKRAADRFASPTLRKWLESTGLSNDVEVLRMFAKMGRAMQDDKFVDGSKTVPAKSRTLEDVFTPKPEKETE